MKFTRMLIVAVVAMLCVSGVAKSAGVTLSFMTEQMTSVDKGNSLGLELGYFLGLDDEGGGLEPYIGADWWPRWDEDGEMDPPSVVVIGARNWFEDIVDPNSAIPFVPDLFLMVLDESVEVKPYVGFRFSANIIDKNAGLMSIPVGVAVKTSKESKSSMRFEIRYNDFFGELDMVPDSRFDLYMGLYMRL